jgi:hypothetical protein
MLSRSEALEILPGLKSFKRLTISSFNAAWTTNHVWDLRDIAQLADQAQRVQLRSQELSQFLSVVVPP